MSDQKTLAKHAAALHRYAKRVQRVLDRLGSLSGVGIALEREQRVPALLSPLENVPLRGSPEPSAELPRGAKETRTGQAETIVFDRWQSDHTGGTDREPLLLVGSLGSGKSAILEAFALRAAATLDEWSRSPDSKPIPPVPLPVRLRSLRFEQGELDHVRDFLVRSQEELAVNDPEGLLSPQVLGELLDAGNVTAFLDGLDELPGMSEFGDIRRRALTTIMRECRGACVISSRPGYGAEAILTRARQHVVCGFSSDQVESLIHHRFGTSDGKHATKLYRNSRERIRAMMSRPLFAAAWCERVASDPLSPPSTVREVMSELYSHCFDHRRPSLPLGEKEQLHSRESLGRVLRCFVDSGRTSLTTDQLRTAMRDDPLNDPDQLLSVLQVAVDAGLMRRVGRSAYSPVPSGLGEYLIAEHLVGLLSRPDDGGPRFVRTFQRWVWLPEYVGILELTSALMSEDPTLTPVRVSLLAWLAGVPMMGGETVHNAGRSPQPTDDLLRPFPLLAFRLAMTSNDTYMLTPEFADLIVSTSEEALGRLWGPGWIESLADARHFAALLPDEIPGEVLDCLLDCLAEAVARRPKKSADELDAEPDARTHATVMMADRIRPADAARAAERWAHRAQSSNGEGSVWHEAAIRAAHRVPESEGERELRRWRPRYGERPDSTASGVMCALATRLRPADTIALIKENLSAASHEDNLMSLRLINSAAAQIPQSEMMDMVGRLIETATCYGGEFRSGIWPYFLGAALSQLDSATAGDIFMHGLAKYRASRKHFLRHAWLFAAQCAAERLAPSDAVATVEGVLMHITPKDAPEQRILGDALEGAAARVPTEEAGDVGLRWFENGVNAGIETEARWWQSAARVAAARASEAGSGRLINSLLEQLDQAPPEQVESRLWLIEAATQHVLTAEAPALLSRLLSLRCEAADSTCQSLWQSSLSHIAGCLPAPAACQLVEQTCDKATLPGPEWVDWDELASVAAKRLENTDARRLYRRFDVPGSPMTTHTWLLRSLVEQPDVREAAWLCRTLLLAGHREDALLVAKRSEAVALVGSLADSSLGGAVEVRDRHDQTLLMDEHLAHAPPVVQALASGGAWRSVAAGSRQPAKPVPTSTSPHASSTDALHLRRFEKLVLQFVAELEEQDDDPPTQRAVGDKFDVSDDTARLACVRLERELDLIHRPDGGRSGYRLTAAGRAVLSSATNRSD